MTCRESREYLYAFLDSELDAPLSMEQQRHLEHCPACAQESEIERHIRRGLEGVLAPDLDESILGTAALETVVRQVTAWPTRTKWRPLGLIGLAALIALVPLLWTILTPKRPAQPKAPAFVQLVVADFQHTLVSDHPVEFASNDRAAVGGWLRDRTGMLVSLPAVNESDFELLGGRKCSLAGHTAAFALYRKGAVSVSLVAVPGEAAELVGMQRRDASPQHWVGQLAGNTVIAWQDGPLVYAAVSSLPEADLLHLIPNAAEKP